MKILNSIFTAQELLKREGIKICYIVNPVQAKEAVNKLLMAKVHLALDIETAKLNPFAENKRAGLDPHLSEIRLFQVYAGGGYVYAFDMFFLKWSIIAPLWKKKMVAHNTVFEMKHLIHAGINPDMFDCSMLMENALNNKLISLESLVKDRLGWAMSKDLQTSNWSHAELSSEQLAYACMDAVAVKKLYPILKNELRKTDRIGVYKLMKKAQRSVAQLELNGFLFDTKGHRGLIDAWEKNKEALEKKLIKEFGSDTNFNSGKQLSKCLEETLPDKYLKGWPLTKTGQLKTDIETFKQYSEIASLNILVEYKHFTKLINTYGIKFASHVSPVTGRIHASFRLGGAVSGRFRSNSPNMQNIPRREEFRRLFEAKKSCKLVVADYGQIELRVAAILSNDRAMLKVFSKGQDLHRKTAALMAGIREQDVSLEQRQAAKAVNFGILYGIGARALVKYAKDKYNVIMSEQDAQKAIRSFFRAYPGIKRWQEKITRSSEITKKVESPGGRVRDFSKEGKESFYNEALNTPIQAGAAEVLLTALAKSEDYFKNIDIKLINIIHDEIILEVGEKEVSRASSALKEVMTESFLMLFPNSSATKLVEIKTGSNWADTR